MLLSVMALTSLQAALSMQPDAFLPCSLKILFSSSVPVQQIIKVYVCLLILLNLTKFCRALKMMLGAFLCLDLTAVQGINLSQ